jgi:hypothetical protein
MNEHIVKLDCAEWHPEDQWLLEAVDTEEGQTKQFALKNCDFVRR